MDTPLLEAMAGIAHNNMQIFFYTFYTYLFLLYFLYFSNDFSIPTWSIFHCHVSSLTNEKSSSQRVVASQSPGKLDNLQIAGPHPHTVGRAVWGQRICISVKFPVADAAASLETLKVNKLE